MIHECDVDKQAHSKFPWEITVKISKVLSHHSKGKLWMQRLLRKIL